MTKKEFDQWFEEYVIPSIKSKFEKDGMIDKPARREAYNVVLDVHQKSNQITKHQAYTWIIPKRLLK